MKSITVYVLVVQLFPFLKTLKKKIDNHFEEFRYDEINIDLPINATWMVRMDIDTIQYNVCGIVNSFICKTLDKMNV